MSDATWLILGSGALGRLLATHLYDHMPVALIGRQASRLPLSLTTPENQWRTHPVPRITHARLPAQPAMLHLTTKAYAAEAALDELAQYLPSPIPLVLWQNGYQAQAPITRRWPGPVLCASTTEGAYTQGDDSVVHAGHGHTFIGHLDGLHTDLAKHIADVLTTAGLSAEPCADIRHRLWHKLAINAAINPLVARYRIRNGQLRDRPFRVMVDAIIEELVVIMAAEGVRPPNEGWITLVWKVIEGTANNRASMLQDVLANRPTERDAILGPLLDAAKRHGIATPALTAMYRQAPR